jgi:hypothetical protein
MLSTPNNFFYFSGRLLYLMCMFLLCALMRSTGVMNVRNVAHRMNLRLKKLYTRAAHYRSSIGNGIVFMCFNNQLLTGNLRCDIIMIKKVGSDGNDASYKFR